MRKANGSHVTSPSATFRVHVQLVQMPAKKAIGRVLSRANHTGTLRPSARRVGSLNEVKGTTQREPGPSQSSPVRAGSVADVGHALVHLFPLKREGWRRHAPSCPHQLTHAIGARADDRGRVVREGAGQRRHVAGVVPHGACEGADCVLVGRCGVEVAHRVGVSPGAEAISISELAVWQRLPRLFRHNVDKLRPGLNREAVSEPHCGGGLPALRHLAPQPWHKRHKCLVRAGPSHQIGNQHIAVLPTHGATGDQVPGGQVAYRQAQQNAAALLDAHLAKA